MRYVYDDLGRLVRVIDETSGEAATYHYDAVGNILAITRATVEELQPEVLAIDPPHARVGTTVAVVISGRDLLGTTLSTDNTGILVSDVASLDDRVSATFAISETAALGETVVTLDTGVGVVTTKFDVFPPLPALLLSPHVVVLSPGTEQTVTVSLSHPDVIDTTMTVTVSTPAIASVSAPAMIPSGQTTAQFTVSALAVGATPVRVEADGRTASAGIYVTEPFSGPVTAAVASVSVRVPEPETPLSELPSFAAPVSVRVAEAETPLSELPSFAAPVSVNVPEASLQVAPQQPFSAPADVEARPAVHNQGGP